MSINAKVGIGTTVPGAELDVIGGVRASSEFRGTNRITTFGTTVASGILAPGEQTATQPAGQGFPFPEDGNLNAFSGNARVYIMVASMQTVDALGGHVYEVIIGAHGQGYNDYTTVAQRSTDGGGLLVSRSGPILTFRNDTGQDARWIVKQLPITRLAETLAP